MSHFTVLVIGDNPEEQLQPFHEYECTGIKDEYVIFHAKPIDELNNEYEKHKDDYNSFEEFLQDWHGYEMNENGQWGRWTNPNAKWDWYLLGGRWAGFFRLKPGKYGTQGHHRAKDFAKITGEIVEDLPITKVDQCLKGNIDVEAMRLETKSEALLTYQKFIETLNGLPMPPRWDDFRASFNDDINEARSQYWANKSVSALSKAGFFDWEDLLNGEEAYIKYRTDSAISTFAVIKEGKWYEKGKMGWSNAKEEDVWLLEFNKLFDSIPDDTLVSVYDCHI